MKIVKFKECSLTIAENQPQYHPMPAFKHENDPQGKITTLWTLSWRERFIVLFTGEIWHSILTFNLPVQPQLLEVRKPAMFPEKKII